jgi:hypothetical protein
MASAERRPIDLAEGWGAMQVRGARERASGVCSFLRESSLSPLLSLRAVETRLIRALSGPAAPAPGLGCPTRPPWACLRAPVARAWIAGPRARRFDETPSLPSLTSLLLSPPPNATKTKQQEGIDKLVRLLEDDNEAQFNAEQYMQLYT